MRGTTAGQRWRLQAGCWLGRCCAVVFLLVVTHVALMTSERHATVMGVQMGALSPAGIIARLVPDTSPRQGAADHGDGPAIPHSVLGDCPAQQAVPPLILLLLLLIIALLRLPAAWLCADSAVRIWCRRFTLPPPLTAARRRVLLQVFLI
jgi:hypothetical protein